MVLVYEQTLNMADEESKLHSIFFFANKQRKLQERKLQMKNLAAS
jgi:hypothetical protein